MDNVLFWYMLINSTVWRVYQIKRGFFFTYTVFKTFCVFHICISQNKYISVFSCQSEDM